MRDKIRKIRKVHVKNKEKQSFWPSFGCSNDNCISGDWICFDCCFPECAFDSNPDKFKLSTTLGKSEIFKFFCEQCRFATPVVESPTMGESSNSNSALITAILELKNTVALQKSQFDAVIAENKRLSAENRLLSNRVTTLENRNAGQSDFDSVYQAVEEHFSRQEKKNNMVFHNVPEKDSTDEDMAFVKSLVSDQNGSPETVTEVFHMGKPRADGKPRLLKVKCSSAWTKRGLVTGQGNIRDKNGDLKAAKFFIRDDLTEVQRKKDKELRDRLDVLRKDNPNKTLVIRDHQIVEKSGGKVQFFQQ